MIMSHQLRMRPTSDLSDQLYRLLSRHRIDQRVSTGCAPPGCLPVGLAEENTAGQSVACQVTRT